jgi:phospholipase/lecithinase/hemolysin
MRLSRLGLTALFSALSVTAFAAEPSKTFANRIISFGDSYSDIGNRLSLDGVPTTPYWKGRYSNGRVFPELLGQKGQTAYYANRFLDGIGINFALGGAWAGAGGTTLNLSQQVTDYAGTAETFGADDIVTMLAGSNDVLTTVKENTSNAAAQKAGDTAAKAVLKQLGKVLTMRARKVIALNLPALDMGPGIKTNAVRAAKLRLAIKAFDNRMKAGLPALRKKYSKAHIVYFDLNSAMSDMIANGAKYGLSDVTHSCIDTPKCRTGSLAYQDKYMFFDWVHPTQRTHALIAQRIFGAWKGS